MSTGESGGRPHTTCGATNHPSSGTDRGAVGDDHFDWPGFLAALDDAGYDGALTVESFTGDNDTIATAASVWRPLAESQDALAERSLRHLTALLQGRNES